MAVTRLMDLAAPVFLFVASFLRKTERGVDPPYEEVRQEVMTLLMKQEELSKQADLTGAWAKARRPLAFLIDETMVVNASWSPESKARWETETLEICWLGETQTLRGVRFFDECDEELRAFRTSERLGRQDVSAQYDLLEIYYLCLKLGFKGRMVTTPGEFTEYTSGLLTKLPAYARTKTHELFPDTEKYTVKDKPVYTTMLQLSTIVAVFVGLMLTFIVSTYLTWSRLTSTVKIIAEEIIK